MKWPKYVRLQRQKRVLSMRLKVPPAINQVSSANRDRGVLCFLHQVRDVDV